MCFLPKNIKTISKDNLLKNFHKTELKLRGEKYRKGKSLNSRQRAALDLIFVRKTGM